jgi:hypothetical protein
MVSLSLWESNPCSLASTISKDPEICFRPLLVIHTRKEAGTRREKWQDEKTRRLMQHLSTRVHFAWHDYPKEWTALPIMTSTMQLLQTLGSGGVRGVLVLYFSHGERFVWNNCIETRWQPIICSRSVTNLKWLHRCRYGWNALLAFHPPVLYSRKQYTIKNKSRTSLVTRPPALPENAPPPPPPFLTGFVLLSMGSMGF